MFNYSLISILHKKMLSKTPSTNHTFALVVVGVTSAEINQINFRTPSKL